MNEPIILALIAIIATVIAGMFKLLSDNTAALNNVATSNDKMGKEAAERNGHLAELAIENKKSNAKQFKAILATVKDIKLQHIDTQHVDNQTVVTETVEKKG